MERTLRTLGCGDVARSGGGSHRKWRNAAKGKSTVVPDWGGKDLKLGTIKAAVKQLGLEWDAFTAA